MLPTRPVKDSHLQSSAHAGHTQAAAGNEALKKWEERWLGRFARLFHLNRVRLKHYTPEGGLDEQPWKFRTAQRQLQSALNRLFALAEKELAGPAGSDRRAKALRSLVNHREGLSVFIDRPGTPMDNNFAERVLRGPVIGRKLSYGSDSLEGARFSAMMYGVFETLRLNRIDVGRWLTAWLTACAQNGGRPPDDLAPWLPWSVKSEMCWIICLDAAPPRWVSRGRFVPRILRSVRL